MRQSFPGSKLWPLSTSRINIQSGLQADVWDLGISLLTLMDGVPSVARMWRSGRRVPRLANPSHWSSQLNNFLAKLFGGGGGSQGLPLSDVLLQHNFVDGATVTACRAAMSRFRKSKEEEGVPSAQVNDRISLLFRQNNAVVRAPFIGIDDVSADMFDYGEWVHNNPDRPTVEQSLERMLKVCKGTPYTREVDDARNRSRTVGALETFLDTVDMP